MLVVDSVLPGGPAEGRLEAGDTLVRLGGQVLTSFLPLEAALDSAVGGRVTLDVERAGAPLRLSLSVQAPAPPAWPPPPPSPPRLRPSCPPLPAAQCSSRMRCSNCEYGACAVRGNPRSRSLPSSLRVQ